MAEFPAMPLWTDRYLADTRHLSRSQHGSYLLLLMESWRRPRCSLPDDDAMLARLAGCSEEEWLAEKPVIMGLWSLDKRRREWTQKGQIKERLFLEEKRRSQRDKARSRWNKAKKANAVAMPEPCPANAPTPTPTPTFKKEEKEGAGDLHSRVLAAVGINPRGILPTYWLPPSALLHVERWRDLGITDDEIEAVARGSRNGRSPPNGPKALDGAMARFAAEKSAPPLQPEVTTHARPTRTPVRADAFLSGARSVG